ncbi:hypothetical protein DK412_07710 [Methylobacterium sp. 17Sr1-1]|nr:hypothetical protein DK412_07710 [Methylobacterium sp. 17Sr1-1]
MAQDGDNQFSVISSVLADGTIYLPEGAISSFGRARMSDYISPTPASIMAVADTSAPGPPYNVTVEPASDPSGAPIGVRVAFTASASPNVAATYVYRRTGAAGDFAGAALVGQIACGPNQQFGDYIDSVGSGTYRYWLQSRNGSGYSDATSVVGPYDVTVT